MKILAEAMQRLLYAFMTAIVSHKQYLRYQL
jgi:hypothetical protein